ncbi:hypothetical protein E2C01_057882 [Portunus trituberculatus]|uniref:Uncharacterized protein n=1 Tax=Portunus trituberculatus TaxID=210409 RepID=A0A5B7H1K1_PORTR|nr:hypothetical protein [Portunus trituberculatus]
MESQDVLVCSGRRERAPEREVGPVTFHINSPHRHAIPRNTPSINDSSELEGSTEPAERATLTRTPSEQKKAPFRVVRFMQ